VGELFFDRLLACEQADFGTVEPELSSSSMAS
jgi:hypothetical protein